ncbi:helix-turn-helix domain-containing protein [uncultured Kordia sp.]|uniref:helix-turn-helix domain-containing protein n=1 Tax=uncultured Kordia sp. TaxID=507699 RepID=UPI0026063689|nr:helix-turn-helix domain-containing protein [uncultured Kordia sp.]
MSISLFKKYNVLFLCALMSCVTCIVQAQNDNTISSSLDTITFKKSLENKSLGTLTSILYRVYDVDSLKASIISDHIKSIYIASGTPKEVARASITVSIWEEAKGNIEESLSLLEKGIRISREIKNDSILYLGLLSKGVTHYYQADHEPALKLYYEALNIAKKEKNRRWQIAVKSNIALVRMQADDTKGAIELLLENLEKIKKQPDIINEKSRLNLYLNICGAYIYIEDYDAARHYCEEGTKLNIDINDELAMAHFLSAFAEIARSNKEYEKCHRFLDEADEIMEKQFIRKNLRLFLKFYRAKAYFDEKKYQLAVDELHKIEAMKADYDVEILSIQQMYYCFAKSYKELGNSEQAIKYYEKAKQISTENNKIRDKINTNLIKQYDLVKLKEEIKELQQNSKRIKTFYTIGVVLLVIIIIGLLIFNKKQQRKNKQRFENLMNQLEKKRQKIKLHKDEKQTASEEKIVEKSQKISKEQPAKIDPKIEAILTKLEEFEDKELFLDNDSTLVEVAKKIQTNTTYLSKVINTYKEKSFTAYITDLRVDYAIERLSHDRKFRSFTIGAIAQEIGFKRSESFSKAFKVKTGLYPSYFVKELEKQAGSNSE